MKTEPLDPDVIVQCEAEPDRLRQAVALFRYGVIADMTQLPLQHRGLYKLLREKAEREYNIPGSLRRRVAAETIRGWLRAYRRGGFDALVPRLRADQGSTRSIPAPVVDLLCQLKDDEPALTTPLLIKRVREQHRDLVSDEVTLAESTVHRLLARRGLMRKPKDEPTGKDHRRFEYEAAGELWMSDVMYGPKIRVHKQARRTYLIAFIDDATRLVPHAAFAFSEGTIAYLQVLEQAVRRRGLPKRLYVDNGSAFRSRQLGVVCAKLGIALIHARPYTPQGKGKMERWFRTVRMQCLPLLAAEHLSSLDAMNRALAGWIEGEYHHAPHRGLHDETPADKWARTSEGVRMPDSNVSDLFLSEQRRRVQKDRTVTLDGVAFEVDAALVGDHVTLRYDPAKTPDKRAVEVWHQGKRIEIARRVDVLANCFVKRNHVTRQLQVPRPDDNELPEGLSLRQLVDPSADLDDEGLF
jgi:transposase InsO family protein